MPRITLLGGPLDGASLELEREWTTTAIVESDTSGITYRYALNDRGKWLYQGRVSDAVEPHWWWSESGTVQRDASEAS